MIRSIPKGIKKFVSLWIPPILWGLFIFSFSSVTTPRVSDVHWQDFVVKKLAHLIEYGMFAILIFRGLRGENVESRRAFTYTFLACLTYAITDEYHQSMTPGREPTLRDVGIDAVGSFTALLSIKSLLPKIPGKLRKFVFKLGISY